jgi:hypothetical protein
VSAAQVRAGLVATRRYRLREYDCCFRGADLVSWCVRGRHAWRQPLRVLSQRTLLQVTICACARVLLSTGGDPREMRAALHTPALSTSLLTPQ